jgi:transposase InsO family protein
MDFVAQRLPDGRWIRVLTVVDQYTRECVTLLADNTLSGEKVATALDKALLQRGVPESITVDNVGHALSIRTGGITPEISFELVTETILGQTHSDVGGHPEGTTKTGVAVLRYLSGPAELA